jgi:hypothetical protein
LKFPTPPELARVTATAEKELNMTIITETRSSADPVETESAPATLDTNLPVEVDHDLVWLLAQAWIPAPLFA